MDSTLTDSSASLMQGSDTTGLCYLERMLEKHTKKSKMIQRNALYGSYSYMCLDHPFDIHYKAKTIPTAKSRMRGWPKFFVEVWQIDGEGRYSISGYGLATVPFTPGQHTISIKCWRPRPQGFWKRMAAKLLGIQPELNFKDMLFSSAERFGFETETTGTVEIDLGIIVKDFQLHGVELYTEV